MTAARLAPTEHKVRPGDSVISVGCDNGRDATARASRSDSIDKFLSAVDPVWAEEPTCKWPASRWKAAAEADCFTPEGLVIGVCNAAILIYNEGLFARRA